MSEPDTAASLAVEPRSDRFLKALRLQATQTSTSIRLAPMQAVDGSALRALVRQAAEDHQGQLNDDPTKFGASDLKIVQMLWPHLEGLADLFDCPHTESTTYVAPRWQVNVHGQAVTLQSHSFDKFDEALEISGNFGDLETKIEAAQAIAEYLNDRGQFRWRYAVIKTRVGQLEKENARLRQALAQAGIPAT